LSLASPTINFTDKVEINTIVWIQSLPESEQGPSRRIKEDLVAISTEAGHNLYEISASTKDELLNALSNIEKRALAGLRPVLHFDMHGSKKDGLLMAPSGEYVPWDVLASSMRKINVATKNNLCCVFATCFALRFAHQIDILRPVIFNLIIAPLKTVSIGFLEEQTNKFYQSLMATGNISTAYKKTLSEQMRLWSCQEILMLGLVEYIKTQTKGKGRRVRSERLLSEHLQSQNIQNPSEPQLRNARKLIKKFIVPDQHTIDRIALIFLIGRKPGFSFENLRPFFETDKQFKTKQ